MTAKLHFPEDAFALKLFLEGAKRLIDVIVANDDLHGLAALLSLGFRHG